MRLYTDKGVVKTSKNGMSGGKLRPKETRISGFTSQTKVITAYAVKEGYENSPEATATFKVNG